MKHIFIINIRVKAERGKIIKSIFGANGLTKSKVNSTLPTKDMIMEYVKIIEMTTHTCSELIIPRFNEIPKKIKVCKCKIAEIKKMFKEKLNSIKHNETQFTENKAIIAKLEKKILKFGVIFKILLTEN